MTRYSLEDVGGALSWDDLYAFVRNVPATSALFRALEPEAAQWLDGSALCGLVADVYDALTMLRGEFLASKGVKANLERHVRPGDARREEEKMRVVKQRLEELDNLIGGSDG